MRRRSTPTAPNFLALLAAPPRWAAPPRSRAPSSPAGGTAAASRRRGTASKLRTFRRRWIAAVATFVFLIAYCQGFVKEASTAVPAPSFGRPPPMRLGSVLYLRLRTVHRRQSPPHRHHQHFFSSPWRLGQAPAAPAPPRSAVAPLSSLTHRRPATRLFVAARTSPRDRSDTARATEESDATEASAAPLSSSSNALMETDKDDIVVDWGDSSTLSLDRLQERVHAFVTRWRQQQHPHVRTSQSPPLPPKLAVAVAGGGANFVSALSSTPGASSVLLQGTILYDREAFHAYLDQFSSSSSGPGAAAGSSWSLDASEHGTDINGSSFHSDAAISRHSSTTSTTSNNTAAKFQYASLSAARHLSAAALQQACRLSAAGLGTAALRWTNGHGADSSHLEVDRRNLLHRHLTSAVGVGCSSALQTTTTRNGTAKPQKGHSQAHVVVQRPDGHMVHELSMALRHVGDPQRTKGDTGARGAGTDAVADERHGRQVRFLEDVAVAHGILSCIERATDANKNEAATSQVQEGDAVSVEFRAYEADGSAAPFAEDDPPREGLSAVVHEAVCRVLSHPSSVVALVPEYASQEANDSSSANPADQAVTASISFSLLSHFALPPTSMVFPGSFNPVHVGHVQLARAAMDAVPQLRNVVWFEMALTNADKPALSAQEVERRVQDFATLFAGELKALVDFQWGILLSDAPLFHQKVELLHPLLVPASASRAARCFDEDLDSLDVIIGTDTLVRLIDPKYYQGSSTHMVKTLEAMSARFVVGGRATTPASSFSVGHDDVARLPEELQSRFVLLPEETFRVDVSSTEIRRKLQEAGKEELASSTDSTGAEAK